MKDSETPRIPGKGSKKYGDFSRFIKKKETPSRSHKTSKLITKKFQENEEKKNILKNRPKSGERKSPVVKKTRRPKSADYLADGGLIRLNRYIANAGICSRREADRLIQTGVVMVNGNIVSELGTKVAITDKVQIGEQTLTTERPKYVLLNKPKGYITTTDDPQDRKTVMLLVQKAGKERIYPVGRLDRNTSGLLLFTNDGELAKKLSHPSHKIRKVYHVELDQPLHRDDYEKIIKGIELEDGFIRPDAIEFTGEGNDRKDIGVELHSGKNRVVRRIFETLGYKVVKLDRVVYAGLTKKDLPRGKWRFLTEKEVSFLKML